MTAERETQRECVDELRKRGLKVVVTSNRRPTANTRGTPDLFVYVRAGLWAAMDVKSPTGKATDKQAELESLGAVVIVRSLKECLEYVESLPIRYGKNANSPS